MGIEIERKFLVTGDGWRARVVRSQRMRQGYLCTDPGRASIRVRRTEEGAWLNIKGATVGMTRAEFEYPIPPADADAMLDALCGGRLIEKTRYWVQAGGHLWEVDVFEGANAGLVVAEVELESETERLDLPDWVGNEVTEDAKYYNACLVNRPFGSW